MTVAHRVAAAFAGGLFYVAAGSFAQAAPAPVDDSSVTVADPARIQSAAAVDVEDPGICSKSRKRLWVEGEGWIVRRVTICR